ncbi:hypothetical protein SAMN05216168_5338 [Kosakonia radicincitans]|uniref:hypothetical protein n=1 Tax=Kosakonia radicincitans TaxID=283686 RepID=UPI0009C38128|nr:hypothetical protein [Kosakonia radicincitans]SKC23391.1 hypothetical protein SAMN05216168_5338 [Kosakonia radicincitans]
MDNNTVISHITKSTNKEVKSSKYFLFFTLIAGSFFFFKNNLFGDEYTWLFISSADIFKQKLGWINSTWGSILSIHGTIAALSITFMAMFVQQVAEASNKDFMHITRQLVLRRYEFYKFSVDAVCGLLFGVFFLAVGGGVIHYSLSMACSVYFIYQYMKIFKDLYFITEKREIVTDILMSKIKEIGRYIKTKNHKKTITTQLFIDFVKTRQSLIVEYDRNYAERESKQLINPYNIKDKVLVAFSKDKIIELDNYILKKHSNGNIKLLLLPSFYDASFIKDAYIFHDRDFDFTSDDKLNKLISDCFSASEIDESDYFYNSIEINTNQSIINSLITNDIHQLNFCIETLSILIISSMEIDIFQKLQRMIIETPASKNISPEILAYFYKELFYKFFNEYYAFTATVFDYMFAAPRYIFDKETFINYAKLINEFSTERVMYTQNEDLFINYIKMALDNLISKYYSVFFLNSDFLTKKIKYLSHPNIESLSDRQTSVIDATLTVLSYISTRLNLLYKKSDEKPLLEIKDSNEEITKLKELLLMWLNPEFFKEIYYNPSTYDILFQKKSKFYNYHHEATLKEVGSMEVSSIENGYHRSVALALLFFKSTVYNTGLSTIYIRNIEEIINSKNITTFDIDKIEKILQSEYFSQIISLLEISPSNPQLVGYESRRDNSITAFEEIKSKIMQLTMDKIIASKYDSKLTEKYNCDIQNAFLKDLNEFIEDDNISRLQKDSNYKLDFIIDKREIIKPLNGEFYSQSSNIHKQSIINDLVLKLIRSMDETKLNFEKIQTPNILPSDIKLISINSLRREPEDSYKLYRGHRITNQQHSKPFNEDGFYYINFNKCFTFFANKENLIKTYFHKISPELLTSNRIEVNNQNLETYVHMEVFIELGWLNKDPQHVYFISNEDCQKYIENENDILKYMKKTPPKKE